MNVRRFMSWVTCLPRRYPLTPLRFFAVLVILGLVAFAAHAQDGGIFGPWTRFGGDNYSNGSSTFAGPAAAPQISFSVATNGSKSVPVVAPNGKVVISDGSVSCFSSTGVPLWSTSNSGGYPGGGYPGGGFAYGTANPYPPAIGNDGTVYVTTSTNSGAVPRSVVALDLNAPGPSASVKWAYTTGNYDSDGPVGSPVVGPDNTVYCVGAPNSSSGHPVIFAVKAGTLKWRWSLPDRFVVVGQFNQPVLYQDTSGTYLVVSGNVTYAPSPPGVYPGGWSNIRTLVLKDNGTSAAEVGSGHLFPAPTTTTVPNQGNGQYYLNGHPSLSPDGASLIIPWAWTYGQTCYGIACLNINVPAGSMSMRWPALNSNANVPPPATAQDTPATSVSTIRYLAAIDSTNSGVYATTALGTSLLKRRLTDGVKLWQTPAGTAIGGQMPALDKNNIIWIGTNGGAVLSYNPTSGALMSSTNVGGPVNDGGYPGIGVSIGANSDLFLTTTPSNGLPQLLRLH